MKMKQLLMLVGVVIILWVAFVLLDRSAVPTAENEPFVDVDTTMIHELEIMSGGTTVTLTKRDAGWYITNPFDYRANQRYITQLLEKLEEMHIESEVTHNQDRWAEFEVDTAGVSLTIRPEGGGEAYRVVLGKAAESYKQSYARYADGETIYLINGTYKMQLSRTPENWRDKAIFPHDQSMIRAMSTAAWDLVRDDENRWTMTVDGSDVPVKQPDAARIQSQVARMRTSEFPVPEDYAGLDFNSMPDGKLTLGLDSGETATLRFWLDPENERRYFVKYDNDDTVFVIYEGIYNQLFKSVDDLAADEPEPTEEMGEGM